MLRELFARCLSSHPSSVDDADDADARGPSTSMSTLTRTDSAKRSTSTSSTPTTLTPSSSLGKQTRRTLSRGGSAREGSGATKTVAWAKDVETTVVVVKREEEEAFGGRRRERSLPSTTSTTTTGGGRSSGNSTTMILSKDIFYNDAFRESLERRSRRT